MAYITENIGEDVFGLVFDFESDEFKVLRNAIKQVVLSLYGAKSIIPAINMMLDEEEIEIVDYRFVF